MTKTTYKVNLGSDISDGQGNKLSIPYTFSFTVAPPQVTGIWPAESEKKISTSGYPYIFLIPQ